MLNKHYRLKSIQNIAPAASGLLSRIGFSHLRVAKMSSSTMVPVSWTTSAQRERFPDIDHSPHFLHVCVFSSVTPGACHQHLQSCGSCKHNINLFGTQISEDGLHFCPSDPVSWGEILSPATETQSKCGRSTESLHLLSHETLFSLGFSQTSIFKMALNLLRMRKEKPHHKTKAYGAHQNSEITHVGVILTTWSIKSQFFKSLKRFSN